MSLLHKLLGKEKSASESSAKARKPSKLVKDLMSTVMATRQRAIGQVLQMRNRKALEAVEEAVKRLTGKEKIEFYRPGGMRGGSPQEAYDRVLKLAREGRFTDDPALVQSLIPGVAFMNNELMSKLALIDAKALAIYQLLGVQMQLKMQVG